MKSKEKRHENKIKKVIAYLDGIAIDIKPTYLIITGIVLDVLYTIGVPLFNTRYETTKKFGKYFLGANGNTTEFEHALYYWSFLPVLFITIVFAYGVYKLKHPIGNEKAGDIAAKWGIGFFVVSFCIYFFLDFYYGFMYHF